MMRAIVKTRTRLYRLLDRLADGQLDARIRELRGEGLSYEDATKRLYAEFGVEVSANTLRNWARHEGDGEAA